MFFILLQLRVYQAYSNDFQTENHSEKNFCRSTIIRGSLAIVILNYISICIFIFIILRIFIDAKRKIQQQKLYELEMTPTNNE